MVSTFTPDFSASLSLGNLPPCNIDAEEAILGAILLDPTAIERVCDRLPPEAFFLEDHKVLYRAALKLHNQAKPTDLMFVRTWLHDHSQLDKIGGEAKLVQLVEQTVTSVNIDRYAELVLEKFVRRQLIQIGNQTVQLAYESLDLNQGLQSVEQSILEITQFRQVDETIDSEYQRYCKVIDSIRELELKIADPGYRAWKLQILAEKFKRSPKQLQDLYFKSLISEENEPLMDFDQMLAKHGSCLREWFVHGFLPKGSTILLHANGGTGKTKLAYDFIYHLATGSDWSGFPVTSSRRCMIIQADESPSDMLQSLWDRGISQGLPIRYKTKWTVDHIQQLRQEALEYKPEVLVIDSITAVSRNSMFSENDTEYARPVLLFRDLANELGCTIIIIHHSNSQGEARGTRAIFNSVSEVWSLKRVENRGPDDTERMLTIEKSRSRKPSKYKLQFNPEDKSWSCLGKEGEEPNSPNVRTKDLIIDFLRRRQGIAYEAIEIQNQIGGSTGNVRRCAYDLAEEGVISRKQNKLGEAYKYFIGEVITPDHPRSPDDHPPITPSDHPLDSAVASVSAEGDRVITENAIFVPEIEEEKVKSHDQPITPIEELTENIDVVSDSVPERGVIAPGVEQSEEVRSHDQTISVAQEGVIAPGVEQSEEVRSHDQTISVAQEGVIAPGVEQSEAVRSHDQTITPPVSEIVATVVKSIEIQVGEGFTKDELEELRVQGSLSSVISSLYPDLSGEKIEEVESGIYEALPKVAPLSKVLGSLTPAESEIPVFAPQQKTPRRPKEGDRIRHFGGKFGTVLKVNKKGLAKYVIQWDGGRPPESYSQKEFNKFDLEVVEDAPAAPATSQQSLIENWTKYYRRFKAVFQKKPGEFGYAVYVYHPSGAQVELNVPAADQEGANEWMKAVVDAELDERPVD